MSVAHCFGSDNFTPSTPGVAYLWVRGNADGVDFTRSDPVPFNFQPLTVTSLGDGVNYGEVTPLTFEIRNLDTVRHCYDRNIVVPQGWQSDWKFTPSEFLLGVCIDPGQSVTRTVEIKMAAVSPNMLPSGATGEVTVTFVEKEAGQISDSATAQVTRRRQLSSSLGSITPNPSLTEDGRVDPIFTAGTVEGTAVITAVYDSLVATTRACAWASPATAKWARLAAVKSSPAPPTLPAKSQRPSRVAAAAVLWW